jgi:hypothetical protein
MVLVLGVGTVVNMVLVPAVTIINMVLVPGVGTVVNMGTFAKTSFVVGSDDQSMAVREETELFALPYPSQ